MKRNFIFIILLLALFTGQAEAQRRLPGMKSVRFTAEMADGFYSRADRHDAGYAFSLAVATYTKKGNQWVFGCEMLQRNNPYRNTYVPLSQYTGVNNGNRLLDDGASLRKYESFIYGGAVTLEAEGYLSDSIALLLCLRERFVWGGASGRCHFQYGAGVKYIF